MKVPLNNMSHRSLTSSQPASSRAKPLFGSTIKDQRITLAHGSGGKAMRNLIQNLLVPTFNNPILEALEDQATIPLKELLQHGDRLAFTTDSYVVDPLFFPGGNIGELAVNGTVNDLAVSGACPLFLSCGLVIEEGFSERACPSSRAIPKLSKKVPRTNFSLTPQELA
jgi:hypothetical protein